MNKSQLIDAIATHSGLTKTDSAKALDAVTDSITSELATGGDVQLVGFGTFSVKTRAARTGRNPATGEPLQIAAKNVPSFKAGKGLKEAVNG